jgi:hypothetical protein
MLLLLALVILALILFGAGFAVHLLWWIALIALVVLVVQAFTMRR